MVHRAYAWAQRLYAGLGNRLYRAFLPRFLERLEGERDWLRASSETLVGLLGEALGHPPRGPLPWGTGI